MHLRKERAMTETELKQSTATYKTYAEWKSTGYHVNRGERAYAVNGRYVFSPDQVSRRGPTQLYFVGFNTGVTRPAVSGHSRYRTLN